MNITEFARRREVQILVAFGVLTIGGYYFWLKKQKDQLRWANAAGNKLLMPKEPKEVTACKKACAGSSDPVACMGNCLNQMNTTI
jgi:hypothetical protein